MIKIIHNAKAYRDRIAIIDQHGRYTYDDLLHTSGEVAQRLLNGKTDLQEARVAFMVQPGFEYVSTQWGIWRAGGIAVPICVTYPMPSITYLLEDARASYIVASPEFKKQLAPLAKKKEIPLFSSQGDNQTKHDFPVVSNDRRAMILYTSGTTGKPKGVVSTHANIEAQITALTVAWEWQGDDHILNILPLHHVHGIINVLSCALWSGACCQFLIRFNAQEVFETFKKKEINLFMAVPTIYYKLITYWETLSMEEQQTLTPILKVFRLMVSGSAALPVSVMEKWKAISGQILLERYGMTEMGMAISNPYRGERRPGCIGEPLPLVKVRLVDENDQVIGAGESGEIQVKGPNVFSEYWKKPEATKASFTFDGWFRTGDIAMVEDGSYKILGRNSVDIIKSGGYKISALEIEEVLRTYPLIKDCGVVGIPNEEWGEIVAACLVLRNKNLNTDALTIWIRERLPGYKIPRKFLILDDLPRNVMGKVTKHVLKTYFK